MQVADRGILLHRLKYGDSGLILKMYTKEHGAMSFLVQGLKGKNKANPQSLLAAINFLNKVDD